ncbi:PIN domain-containing protein [Allokutzneria sp. NRRL B-24872]|uniref:PIN domain-containing protein n=1 Tax=Allokutzneria sp. NRRL B-24872 TaxID=1137961 RepID=UPI000A38A1D9|nr:PIN domain-containing protein [Allokutzneria sp. NRRL B-24872]
MSSRGRGLYDGFEAYRTPTADHYREAMTKGVVVLDTNVLLSLYRVRSETSRSLLETLEKLGDRLWIPHQVLVEFWKNRESVLNDPQKTQGTIKELTSLNEETRQVIRTWANQISLGPADKERLIREADENWGNTLTAVRQLADGDPTSTKDTGDDAVLERLENILQNRVGPPLPDDEHNAAVKEAARRREAKVPPGFRDTRPGDYLIWKQVLIESKLRSASSVLLVTADVKEDWWRYEDRSRRGPRTELAEELRSNSGSSLYMLRTDDFLKRASVALSVAVSENSFSDVGQVAESASDGEASWTQQAADLLLERLRSEGWKAQADTIAVAAENGGFINRQTVYALGEFHENRLLRGFTRPVNRITEYLRTEGMLSAIAPDALTAVYDDANSSLGAGYATGFRVTPQLVALFAKSA